MADATSNRGPAGAPDEVDNDSVAAAKAVALRLLTVRARSRAELAQRLARRGFPPPVVTAVLDWCQRLDYVNDERFVEEWVRARSGVRASGRRRLQHQLLAKGLSPELVRQKLDELLPEGQEQADCLALARAQYARYQSLPAEVRRRRLSGFLLRRGFAPDAVRRAIAQVDSHCERH